MAVPAHTSPEIPVWDADGATIREPVLLPLFSPANRRAAWADAAARGADRFPTLVDPTTILPRRIAIAEGVYVNAGCVIGARATLGAFALVNRAASLGHDARLGTFASIGPGVTLAGGVMVGDGAMIGAGAIILPNVRIGARAVVGAGSVVRRDVPDDERWIGRG